MVWLRREELALGPRLTVPPNRKGEPMLEFENQITIDRQVGEVFEFATDLTSVPKWNYFVRRVTHVSGAPGEEGAVYHQVRKQDEQQLRIVRKVDGETFVVETILSTGLDLRREMAFSQVGKSTHIVDRWRLDLGVPALLEPLAVGRVKKAVRENLGKLKTLLEVGTVTLQDGRTFAI